MTCTACSAVYNPSYQRISSTQYYRRQLCAKCMERLKIPHERDPRLALGLDLPMWEPRAERKDDY